MPFLKIDLLNVIYSHLSLVFFFKLLICNLLLSTSLNAVVGKNYEKFTVNRNKLPFIIYHNIDLCIHHVVLMQCLIFL